MAKMDYFRRPLLAGKNLPKSLSAVLRGSLRRSNPDQNSTVPYFPGVTPDSTLIVKVNGVEYTVTFTGNGYQTVLSEIGTALTGVATATDLHGCVGIQSSISGGVGSVEVVGGTAAAALGFDLKDGTPLRAVGGDLPSSPEAGVGNPYGTAFPSRQENLSTDSFRTALGRLSANSDVMYSDLARRQTKLAKVADLGVGAQGALAGTTRYTTLSLPAGTELFNGYGVLSGTSTKEDLVPYFVLVDQQTKQPAASRVVGMVRGTLPAPSFVGGVLQPYANATTSDGVGNVLGQLLPRPGAQNAVITDIRNARVLKAAAGAFSKTRVGDWVKIDGLDATINKDPSDNRGLRWVVEEKIGADDDAIAVRPMSSAELAYAGTVVNDAQPVVELNDQKQAAQVFGTVTVYAGPFLNDAQLIVSPPINDTVELWAAVPVSYRDQRGYEDSASISHLARTLVSDVAADPDSIVSAPSVTLSGTINGADRTANFGEMYVRWHGRVVRVGAQSIVIGGSKASNIYLYLDAASLRVELTTNPVTAAANLILGYVPAGSQASFVSAARVLDARAHGVTVGTNAQFPTLQAAMQWIAAQGTAEKYDVYVLNDLVLPAGGIKIPSSIVNIIGAGPAVTLTPGDASPMFDLQGYTLKLTSLWLNQVSPFANVGLLLQENVRYVSSGSYSVAQNSAIGGLTFAPSFVTLDSWGANAVLDLGVQAATVYLGKADDAAYTTVRSKFKTERTGEILGGLTVGKTDGTGNALFNGDVTIGVAGRTKALAVVGTISATGNVTLGSSAANLLTSIGKVIAQGGLEVGTTGAWKDLTVFGAQVVKGNLTVEGTLTANLDIIGKGDLDLTQATGAKGVVKARTAQVAGTNGFNVDSTGNVTVGGAGKAFVKADGSVGNANASITPAGQVVGKTTEIAGSLGFRVDASGNVNIGAANRIYLGVDGLLKGRNFRLIAADGTVLSEIGTDGAASFAKSVTVNAAAATDGLFMKRTGATVGYIDGDGVVSGSHLRAGGYKVVDMPQGNPARGGMNPIFLGARAGRRLFTDEEFMTTVNGISVYNNGTGGAVTHQRTADASAPNKTGYIIRINGSSSSGATPGHGGFTFSQMSRVNAVFVQLFRAKVPTGTTLTPHNNYFGDNAKVYFLTNDQGTGKWEDYAVVWVCGNNFSQAAGTVGFIAASNSNATSVVWDLASATMFDVTDLGLANGSFGNIDAMGYVKAQGPGEFYGLKTTLNLDASGTSLLNVASIKNPGYLDFYTQVDAPHRFYCRNLSSGADEHVAQFGRDRHWLGNKRLESIAEGNWGSYDALQVRQYQKCFWPNDTGGNNRNPVDWVDAPTNNGEGGTRAWPDLANPTNNAYPNIYRQDGGGYGGAYYWECPTLFYPQNGTLVWGLRSYTISPEAIFYWWNKAGGEPYRKHRLVLQRRYWWLDKNNPGNAYKGGFISDWTNLTYTTPDTEGITAGPWDIRIRDKGNFGWLEDTGHYYRPPSYTIWLGQDVVYQFRLKLEIFHDDNTALSWDSADTQFLWRYAKINVR